MTVACWAQQARREDRFLEFMTHVLGRWWSQWPEELTDEPQNDIEKRRKVSLSVMHGGVFMTFF